MAESVDVIVSRLASRTPRSEVHIQVDVRGFLLAAPLDLSDEMVTLESAAADGTARRIDVEVGACVIEVKRDLRPTKALTDAMTQLAGYLRMRTEQTGGRYVGVLTDGTSWHLYTLSGDGSELQLASTLVLAQDTDSEPLIAWFDAVLATTSQLPVTPEQVTAQLGAESPAFKLDALSFLAAYESVADNPDVVLKRSLWAKLLTTAMGTQFHDATSLFVEHTYLVTVAELVAHAVAGFDLANPALLPRSLVTGDLFRSAGIVGVVESDFFDWLIEAPHGDSLIRSLAKRIARFDWSAVEHDVLKVLYESVIGPEQRHSLGEYYTPDWLAERVVAEVVPDPLDRTVLDPACGSGTFVFHAVRNYVGTAEAAGWALPDILDGATRSVFGMDVHPVAVTLARVTYLLALGADRIRDPERPALSIPVYLGDSLQWEQGSGVLGSRGLAIEAGDEGSIFDYSLRFPEGVMSDPPRFDQLVTQLTDMATNRAHGSPPPSLKGVVSKFAISEADATVITETFDALCRLNDEGRNHIWGYYVRNLARPLWLNRPDNRLGALVGNPPWLAYRYMTADMQGRLREAMQERAMWAGAKVATQQDLSGYFVARTAELYLTDFGRFGFVMPYAVLSRLAYEGFRSGGLRNADVGVWLSFDTPWDLHEVKPDPFPVPCAVIFGTKCDFNTAPKPMPTTVEKWVGRIPAGAATWTEVQDYLACSADQVQVATTGGDRSPYAERFTQGANLVPRMLVCVVQDGANPLGAGAGRVAVRSMRSTQEKMPWRARPDLVGHVEQQFVFRVHLGSTVAPYRLLEPWQAVLPVAGNSVLSDDGVDLYPDLRDRWGRAEAVWRDYRQPSTRISLTEQVDWQGKLSKQFPPAPIRVVYTASGTRIAAAVVQDTRAVIEHKLYWAPVASAVEGRYLSAILNSGALLERVQGLQSRGQFGRRDFDTYVFAVPFPLFDGQDPLHMAIAEAAERAELVAAGVEVVPGSRFQTVRASIREALDESGLAPEIEQLIQQLFAAI
jgi:hypothetical protein